MRPTLFALLQLLQCWVSLCSNMRKIQSEWLEMGGGQTVFLYSSAQNRGWREGALSDPFCNLICPQRGNINTRPVF